MLKSLSTGVAPALTTGMGQKHTELDLEIDLNAGLTSERFTYGGRDGRVSYKETHIGQADRFVQSWLYDPLGVTSQTFPRCLTAPCASAGTPGQVRTVTRRYAQGQLTSIPGYAGSIAYHPSGLVAQVDHTKRRLVDHRPRPERPRPAVVHPHRQRPQAAISRLCAGTTPCVT